MKNNGSSNCVDVTNRDICSLPINDIAHKSDKYRLTELDEKIELITENKKLVDKLDSKFYLDGTVCDSVSVRNICGIPLNGRLFTDEEPERMKIVVDGEEFEIFKGNRKIANMIKEILVKQMDDYIVKDSGTKQQEAAQRFLRLTSD